MCPLFFKSDSFGWHYYIYRYVGILKLDKGGLGCCQRRVVVYKTEDTSSWLHTIYMEMRRFHQTEQNLNILIDIPISKKTPLFFYLLCGFSHCMYDNNIASASKLPPMFIFPKEIVHIQYICTYIHKQYLQHNFCKRRVLLLCEKIGSIK